MVRDGGSALTVLGPVEPSSLGVVMPHEHLFVDLTCMFDPPTEASDRSRAFAPFSLEHLGWIRTHYFRHHPEPRPRRRGHRRLRGRHLQGGEAARRSSTSRRRESAATRSRSPGCRPRTGVNVVMATGFYVAATHPPEVGAMTETDVANRMIEEIRVGRCSRPAVGSDQDWDPVPNRTGVRAGIIKAAASYPLHPEERKVLRAAAVAQRATGAPITVHVGRHEDSALEILDSLRDAGADLTRCSLDHLDLRVERMEMLLEIAESGCLLEFDMFGHESSYYPLTRRDMPSDAQRLDVVGELVAHGLTRQILISQDICTKHRLVRYGGHGYRHVVEHVAMRMRERGWADADIEALLAANPARLLSFASAR